MLRIIAQTSSAAAKSYYSTSDYLSEDQELAGVWRGQGAERLGLSGDVKQQDWDALCDNRHPATGKTLTARRNDYRRVGWDFNFSVPKSVSLLYALTKDPRILDAFNASVDETMADVEKEVQTRVRVGYKNEDRVTGNLCFGRFTHFTSRPVDGTPDPQLHAHCFVFNATHDPPENRWKSAQIASLKRDANYFSALMHSRLAARLAELGVPVERTAKSWRIAGLAEQTEAKFSRRTQQIEAEAERLGIADPEEKAALGAKTRDRKNKHLSWDELRALWLSRLTPDESHAVQLIQGRVHDRTPVAFDPAVAGEAVRFAADHHFERSAVIPERELLATALNHALGAATPEIVLATGHRDDLIVGTDHGRVCVTSPFVLEEERRMVAYAKKGLNAYEPLVAGDPAPAPDWFNAGQRKALEQLLSSRDAVTLLAGKAGVGKSTVLGEFRKRVEAGGGRVFAFAPSTEASRGVLRDAGFETATTLATLLVNPKAQEAVRAAVILVDEASQISSPDMAKLFAVAERENARVVLSGDRFQHGSVARGSALRLLEQEAGVRGAQLTHILRQRDQYRQAVAYLSQGRVEAGFKMLDDLNWVQEVRDPTQRYERAAAEYVQATEAGKSVVVISPSNAESERVSQTIRGALQREGKVGADKAGVLKLTNRHLTPAQRRDAASYTAGDIVIFSQNAKGYQKGKRLTVGVDPVPLALADRFNVYRPGTLPVAEGDAIRLTANLTSAEGRRLNNGQRFTIAAVAADGTLTLSNGAHVGPAAGFVSHAYAGTSFANQGVTKDRIIFVSSGESLGATNRETLYVAASRGRERCSILTDDKQDLLDAASESGDRLTATELAARRLVRSRLSEQERIDRQGTRVPGGEVRDVAREGFDR